MSQAFTPACLDRRLDELQAAAGTPLLCAVSGGADSLALAQCGIWWLTLLAAGGIYHRRFGPVKLRWSTCGQSVPRPVL